MFQCSVSVLAATSISSTKQHTPGKLISILSIVRCHNAGLEATLNSILFTLNNPLLVFTVATKFFASLVQLKLLECSLRSILETTVFPLNLEVINSSVGKGWCAISICVLTVGL